MCRAAAFYAVLVAECLTRAPARRRDEENVPTNWMRAGDVVQAMKTTLQQVRQALRSRGRLAARLAQG